MKKIKILSAALLVVALALLALTACSKDVATIPSDGIVSYNYEEKAAFGEIPDEPVRIDGILDEPLWDTLNYWKTYHAAQRVTLSVGTHFSEKGLYIAAKSDDMSVYWNGKNYYHWNTHFVINIASAETTEYSANVASILIDANNVFPGYTRVNAEAAVIGEPVNTGRSDGLSVEMFITWEDLGISLRTDSQGNTVLPEYVQLYSRYRYVGSNNGTSSAATDLRNVLDYSAQRMANYGRFNRDGYMALDAEDAVVGDSGSGLAKSAGWDVSRESEGEVTSLNALYQAIFFKQPDSNKFVMTTKMKRVRNVTTNIEAKAGLITYKNNMDYRGITLELANANLDGDKVRTDKLYSSTYYPNNTYMINNIYEGNTITYPDGQELVELTMIKDDAMFYYIVNGKFVYAEEQSYMSGNVAAGLYSNHGSVTFSDYSFQSFDNDEEGLEAEIAKYCYTITSPNSTAYAGGVLTTNTFAVSKENPNATVTLSFVSRSGYILTDILNNNASIYDEVAQNAIGNTYIFTNITSDIDLSAVFSEIPADNVVRVQGLLSDLDRPDMSVGLASIVISAYDGAGDPVPLFHMTASAGERGTFDLRLVKGYAYEIVFERSGYRKTTHRTEIINEDILDDSATTEYEGLNISVEPNVVGGNVYNSIDLGEEYNNRLLTVTEVSSTVSWDFSRENESIVIYDSNTPNAENVWFTNQIGRYAVAEVTITNVTDTTLYSDYEKDPSAGFMISGGGTLSFIGLLRTGLRILPTNNFDSSWHDEVGLVSNNTVNAIGTVTKLKMIRVGSLFYMYINDNYVYTYDSLADFTTRVATNRRDANGNIITEVVDMPTAFGFKVTTSYPISIMFSDYSLLTEEDAMETIYNTVYSEARVVDVDGNKISDDSMSTLGYSLSGVETVSVGGASRDGFVKQGSTFTFSVDSGDEAVYELRVYSTNASVYEKYYLSQIQNSIDIVALNSSTTNIYVIKHTDNIALISGTLRTYNDSSVASAVLTAVRKEGEVENGVAAIKPAADGTFSVQLLAGDYVFRADLAGCYPTEKDVSVTTDSSIGDIVLEKAVIGGAVRVGTSSYSTASAWIKSNDTLKAPGRGGNISAYFTDISGSEYAISIVTRTSKKTDSIYYNNDNVQGLSIMGASRQLNILMFNAGFRVMFGGWNQTDMIETAGSGWNFTNPSADLDYEDITMTVVRRGEVLYVYVGCETPGRVRPMRLYLTISAQDGVVPVQVDGNNHIVTAGSASRMSVLQAGLASMLGTTTANGFGYTIHMNLAVGSNINNSMIYGASAIVGAGSADIGSAHKILSSVSGGGSISYSGEGYIKDGEFDRYSAGEEITFTFTPEDQRELGSLKINNVVIPKSAWSSDGENVTYTATFDDGIYIEAEFVDETFAVTATGLSRSWVSAITSVRASNEAGVTISPEYTTTSGVLTIRLPRGAWTVTVVSTSTRTATVTVTDSDTTIVFSA